MVNHEEEMIEPKLESRTPGSPPVYEWTQYLSPRVCIYTYTHTHFKTNLQ